jgi:serine/threonine-protein phosphatase 4 catalytic subunit
MPNLTRIIQILSDCQLPEEQELLPLFAKATELLQNEPNIKHISAPVTICGDLHGQFFDLQELFRVGGECPDTHYCFLGDYVNRGYHSVETFLYLLAFFVRYPTRMILLRGNHEARQMTQAYGFYDECIRKFGTPDVWKHCIDLFDLFPIAAIVNNEIFCVHGGLSPHIKTISDILAIPRKEEPPTSGAFCDLLWSDPDDITGFAANSRGAGCLFGGDTVKAFLQQNGLKFICRGHQLMIDGYELLFDETLATIWSAPNYCYRTGNVAAVLEFDEKLRRTFRVFEATQAVESRNGMQSSGVDYFS